MILFNSSDFKNNKRIFYEWYERSVVLILILIIDSDLFAYSNSQESSPSHFRNLLAELLPLCCYLLNIQFAVKYVRQSVQTDPCSVHDRTRIWFSPDKNILLNEGDNLLDVLARKWRHVKDALSRVLQGQIKMALVASRNLKCAPSGNNLTYNEQCGLLRTCVSFQVTKEYTQTILILNCVLIIVFF